ncbi:alpha/beta hydrolase [Intrasporangium sp. DVR]|uniref:alpha/beta hydrolase n=1 Tax=Intrasporangium sp. DVR TaxID=3127867 RepID=UPI00313A4F37
MRSSTHTLVTADGTPLFVRRWLPDDEPRAVVGIAHGMAEHSARYDRFAQRLTRSGYAVYAADHRGHGQTADASTPDHLYFADKSGFGTVVDDLREVIALARSEQAGLPVFLFGHSMGSFLARAFAIRWGSDLDGLVLAGTSKDQGVVRILGQNIARLQPLVFGRRHRSTFLDSLASGRFNAAFKPNRTPFDWLTRDEAEVDRYISDAECGNLFTTGAWLDQVEGLVWVNRDRNVARVPKDLPILLVSGDQDPVGEMGKGIRWVTAQYERVGVRDVTMRLYPGARHELLNETNRDEVMDDIVGWLDERVDTRSTTSG